MLTKLFKAACPALIVVLTVSCSGKGEGRYSAIEGDTLTNRAELLTLVDKGAFVSAEIADPWTEGKTLGRYALVKRNKPVPEGLDKEYTVVTVPLERSIIYSSTNSAAIAELDALDAIAGVAEGQYYADSDTISHLIASGRITDIGSSVSPKPETIVNLEPDAILVSPYQNAGHGVIGELGVPIIDFADYMETEPLARAEWIKLLGELYDRRELAQSVYSQVSADYQALVSEAAKQPEHPRVIVETLTSGVWYMPGGRSYMARMLTDAGADYPWSDNQSTGSLQLDMASVIDRASDADIWLMRTFGYMPTRATLTDISPLNERFKAFKDGRVYACDTKERPVFNDIAFHPERVLLDYIIIFHPDFMPGVETLYYKQIEQ